MSILLFTIVMIATAGTAYGSVAKPSFPTCDDPQGTQKVIYMEGVHGIPGSSDVYFGSDVVYVLSEDTLIQCFCAVNGDGIQTDWWNASSLSIDEIEQLTKEGWLYIPDGSRWGLDKDPYMARNSNNDCSDDPKKDPKKDKDDDDDDSRRIGGILGSSSTRFGDILGLPNTGNVDRVFITFSVSLLSIILVITLYLRHKENKATSEK